jgi:outer membrane protein assembly factor BamB
MWQTHVGGSGISVMFNDTLYVGTVSQKLWALDPETGAARWVTKDPPRGWIGDIVADNDVVYIIGRQGAYAFDVNSGKTLWQQTQTADVAPAFAVHGNGVYVVGFHKGLCALDRTTGNVRWEHPEINRAGSLSKIGFHQGVLYVRHGRHLCGINPENGTIETRMPLFDGEGGTYCVHEGVVYSTLTNQVRATPLPARQYEGKPARTGR